MNSQELADRFSRRLRIELTVDEINEVIELNKTEANPHVCHSHDFCDANMVMYDAIGVVPTNQHEGDLWSEAWDLAKASEFKPAEYLAIEKFVDSEWTERSASERRDHVEELFYNFIDNNMRRS